MKKTNNYDLSKKETNKIDKKLKSVLKMSKKELKAIISRAAPEV